MVCKVIFVSNPTEGYVRLSCVVVELGQSCKKDFFGRVSGFSNKNVRIFYMINFATI